MSTDADVQVTNPDEPGMGHNSMGWRKDDPRKFFSAPAERNKRYIAEAIVEMLRSHASGTVLEIGSGSGQHIAHLAPLLPSLSFQPCEFAGHPNPRAQLQSANRILASISAYCETIPNVLPPAELDASQLASSSLMPDSSLVGLIAINVLHVSPLPVLEGVFSGASTKLAPGGTLFLFGPFARDGIISGEANLRFQQSLKELNPNYGLRDITDLTRMAAGLGMSVQAEIFFEQSNNYLLCYQKN